MHASRNLARLAQRPIDGEYRPLLWAEDELTEARADTLEALCRIDRGVLDRRTGRFLSRFSRQATRRIVLANVSFEMSFVEVTEKGPQPGKSRADRVRLFPTGRNTAHAQQRGMGEKRIGANECEAFFRLEVTEIKTLVPQHGRESLARPA